MRVVWGLCILEKMYDFSKMYEVSKQKALRYFPVPLEI